MAFRDRDLQTRALNHELSIHEKCVIEDCNEEVTKSCDELCIEHCMHIHYGQELED